MCKACCPEAGTPERAQIVDLKSSEDTAERNSAAMKELILDVIKNNG